LWCGEWRHRDGAPGATAPLSCGEELELPQWQRPVNNRIERKLDAVHADLFDEVSELVVREAVAIKHAPNLTFLLAPRGGIH
jgi:hypothetical protein